MIPTEPRKRLRFVYDYQRQGASKLWRPVRGRMTSLGPDEPWDGPGVAVSVVDDHRVEVTICLETDPAADADDAEWEASQQADATFQAHVANADLGDVQSTPVAAPCTTFQAHVANADLGDPL